MNTAYRYNPHDCKPSILEVIGKYDVTLRRTGKEYTGLCPFHADKNPSMAVNDDKGLFHCFACGTSGDVIRFVELIEHVPFKEACARLSLDTFRPVPRPHKAEAEQVTRWALDTSRKICDAMRDIGEQIYVCSAVRRDKELLCSDPDAGSLFVPLKWNSSGAGRFWRTWTTTLTTLRLSWNSTESAKILTS